MDHFERDGLIFDVRDTGAGEAGTIVALHGFPQTSGMWDGTRPLWEAAGLRVVTPDQRGYSPAARPPGIRPYAQRELVRDAVRLIEALDVGPVHLVGHDWGGAIAWSLAARHPELLHSLTVLSTPHPLAFRSGMLRGQALKSWYFLALQVPRAPEALLRREGFAANSLRSSGLDSHGIAAAEAQFAAPGGATAAVNWYRALRFGLPAAGPVAVPTLYVWGERDRFLSRAAARGTAAHVSAPYRFVAVEGGTHWLAEERPGQVADLVLDHLRGV
ncbi:alpha/beta fold hydrolase [Jatrophihabitans sp. YIM 134969]